MYIRYGFDIEIECQQAMPLIVLLDVHPSRRHDIVNDSSLQLRNAQQAQIYVDGFGNICRRVAAQPGIVSLSLDGVIRDSGRPDTFPGSTPDTPVGALPPEHLPYLLGSRYCDTDKLTTVAWERFGQIVGGWHKVQAICDFVHGHLTFDYQQARSTRSAFEAYNERVGVCRDFAHLAIALCRSMNVPARYATGYLGDIGVPKDPAPMDFSAWFEAFIGGQWYTFDARHNRPRIGRIVMARGRDATDVPIVHSFGAHTLRKFIVIADETEAQPVRIAAE